MLLFCCIAATACVDRVPRHGFFRPSQALESDAVDTAWTEVFHRHYHRNRDGDRHNFGTDRRAI